jgi:uncharacterized phiE125 gp8 family phage protein
MATTVTAISEDLPVSLAEAKEHLRILHSDLDQSIQTALDAAVEYCEATTGRALREELAVTQTYSEWPCGEVGFDRQPVKSIASVKYYDANGSLTTVSSSLYRLFPSSEAATYLEFDDLTFTAPFYYDRSDTIQINYLAGYTDADSVPARAKQAIKLKLAELFGDLKPQEAAASARACDDLLASISWGSYR